MLAQITLVLIGLSEGLVVGGGIVSFLVILDLVPRLAQLTRTEKFINLYESSMTLGAVYATIADIFSFQFHLSLIGPVLVGFLMGVFVGLLAGALAEVLNVLPIMSRRLQAVKIIALFVNILILGKVCGSLIYWLIPSLWQP